MATVQDPPARVDPPRIGLKLTPTGKDQQEKDPQHVLDILEDAQSGTSLGARTYRLFNTRTPNEIEALLNRTELLDPTYKRVDLNAWYQVFLSTTNLGNQGSNANFSDPQAVDKLLLDVLNHPEVANAYAIRTGPPPGPQFPDTANGYLDTADNHGLGVRLAWGTAGDPSGQTAGQGVKVVDIEGGWYTFDNTSTSPLDLYNDDLPDNIITLNPNVDNSVGWHGNNVLGIILMQPGNGIDGSGIAPASQAYTMGHTFAGPSQGEPDAVNIAVAIMESLLATEDVKHPEQFLLRPGDVILLETSTGDNVLPGVKAKMPSECEPPVFSMIRIATALGIIVVEAAGNANQNLTTTAVNNKLIFKRDSPDFQDSGAILVGASDPTSLKRWITNVDGTNYGERVDVFAWGANIHTTALTGSISTHYTPAPADFCPDPTRNVPAFGGTSAAAAIIVGAIMLIQRFAQQHQNGQRFSPSQMRQLLRDNGTWSMDLSSHPTRTEIGVMPNLVDVLTKMGLVPDIYVRHFAGDLGDGNQTLTLDNFYDSPDIMLNPSSGTSHPYKFGVDQTINITIRNRGKVNAADVKLDLYWAHAPNDLVDLTKWNLIGNVTVGNVRPPAQSNDGTAVATLTWHAGIAVPAGDTRDLCLITIANCATDPGINVTLIAEALNAPIDVPEGMDLQTAKELVYLHLLQINNNIAQLKFGVVN
jgi:serine protease